MLVVWLLVVFMLCGVERGGERCVCVRACVCRGGGRG